MALPKVEGTIQKSGRYHSNIRVPESIRKHYGGKEMLRRSLKTSDPRTAEKEVRAIRAILDAQMAQAKAEEGWQALAQHLSPDQRALLDRAGGLSGLLKQFQDGKSALAFMEAGAPADADGIEIYEGADGVPLKVVTDDVADPEELQVEVAEHRAASAAIRAQTNARGRVLRQLGQDVDLAGDVFSLRDVIEEWAPTVDPQTADAARYYVRRFTELNGEIAVTDLEKSHVRDFAKAIGGLPVVTSGKLPDGRFVRDLPFNECVRWAKKNGKATLSDDTRDKYVSIMKRLLGFAAEQDYRYGNPWRDYKIPRVKQKHSDKNKEKRRPFTAEEVRRILDFVSFSNEPQYAKSTIDYWGPWIAAHHGTRLQETCQLRLCDFAERDGVYCMQITDEGEGMRAKSGATVRWVPVHPKLLEIGLRSHIISRASELPADALAFDQWGRRKKNFEELQPDKRGRVSADFGKRFAYLRGKKLEITGEKVSFHSFRHRLQDAADNVSIADSHRRFLTGRANKDAVEGGYGDGASMRYLLESLEKVDPMRG